MPYCFKCGVEVNNGVKNCPLCDMDLPVFKEEKVVEPRYPSQENVFKEIKKRRRNVFYVIFAMIVLAILVNLRFIDWRFNDSLTWSKYTTKYLLGSLIYMFAILQYIKNPKVNFFIVGINTLILLFFTDIANGNIDWFYQMGIPITVLATVSLYSLFVICTREKLLPYKIMEIIFIVGIFVIVLELIINMFLFNKMSLSWSLQTVVCSLPLLMIIIFIPRRFYKKIDGYIQRKLHM